MNFSQIGTRASATGSDSMSAAREHVVHARHAWRDGRPIAEHFAEDDAAMRAVLLDEARRRDRRRDVGRAADDARLRRPRRSTSSTLSTPFCSVRTVVDGPVSARSIGSAVALS